MKFEQKFGRVIFFAAIFLTFTITPFFSYDAINIGRFTNLVFFGFIAFACIFLSAKTLMLSKYRTILLITAFFIFWEIVSFINSPINFDEKLFGVTGRQFGLVTQICFASLMLLSVLTCSVSLMNSLIQVLIIGGLTSSMYGILQYFGLDPIPWINPYSPVFGLFGNPNFHSAYMGMTASVALALLCFDKKSSIRIIYYLSTIGLCLLNIKWSKSLQGFLVFYAGISVVVFFFLVIRQKASKTFSLLNIYLFLSAVSVIAIISDILQKSPWTSLLYKESVSYRGDFWRAGVSMTKSNLIFGVGPDGYRDQFRLYRDLTTVSRSGSDVPTDSAHNGFLDLSSTGGLPLLVTYFVFIVYAIVSVYKLTKRLNQQNLVFIPILTGWIAYLSQFIISTSHLALAFWGWVLPGLLIGYELKTREKPLVRQEIFNEFRTPLAVFLGGAIGLGLGLPLLIADASFQSSVKSGIVSKIEGSIELWPRSSERMNLVSQLLREGDFPENSIVIARKAVKFNRYNYESWRELSNQPNATKQEREKAVAMMKKLDPNNSNLN